MLWRLIFTLILIGCVIYLCKGVYHYIPLSRFHHFVVPVYCLIMFLMNFTWDPENLILLVILTIIAAAIGWYQTTGIETKIEPGKKGRLRYLVKRNRPYVIGWIVLLAGGIALGELSSSENLFTVFSDKIFEDFFQELDPLLIFTEKHPWYVWLMSGISCLTFAYFSKSKIDQQFAAEKKQYIHTQE